MTRTLVLNGLRHLRKLIAAAAVEAFQPLPRITISEWADEHRILPATSAEPGRFRTARLPYLKRIQDVLGDETTREVVFAKAAQIAGSTAGENFIGFAIDQDPSGIICVWPTDKKLRKWSLSRLDPLLQDSPCLARKFQKSGRRDSSDSMDKKIFPGGWLWAVTARSTSDLKSDSARRAIAEELDEWEVDVKAQGDPLGLLRVRLRTFWNSKLFIVSTPTIEGSSRIWKELTRSTWEEFWVPCPHCQEMQTLRWRDGDEDPDAAGQYRLTWDRDDEGMLIPGSTRYVCAGCSCVIEERWKDWMLQRGEWRGRFPGRSVVGFHINTIYSPLCPWDDIVRTFEQALHSDEEMKIFVNTMLGLPYRPKGENISSHFLAARAEEYPKLWQGDEASNVVPAGVGLLTAAVDVQGDRLELFVWGWGAESERWLIAWDQITGDPGGEEVWLELERRRLMARPHQSGATLSIAAMCVDAGYQTDMVHRYCDSRQGQRVIAIVGRSGAGRKLLQEPDRAKFKRSSKKRPTHIVGTDSGKSLLASALRVETPGPGYVHFPDGLDPVFYEQLTAERLVTRYTKRGPARVWELIHGRRNEALDGSVYAEAALLQMGSGIRTQLAAIVKRVNEMGAAAGGMPITQTARPAPRRQLSRGLNG